CPDRLLRPCSFAGRLPSPYRSTPGTGDSRPVRCSRRARDPRCPPIARRQPKGLPPPARIGEFAPSSEPPRVAEAGPTDVRAQRELRCLGAVGSIDIEQSAAEQGGTAGDEPDIGDQCCALGVIRQVETLPIAHVVDAVIFCLVVLLDGS